MFRIVKIFSYNHRYDFFQEYLRTFECQINRYEKTKENMYANHKNDTKLKTKINFEYLKRKRKN